jgi:hypothetical protein
MAMLEWQRRGWLVSGEAGNGCGRCFGRQGLGGAGARRAVAGRANARRAEAQRVAERAEDAAEAGIGGEEGCDLRISEEMAELGGAGGDLRRKAQQPCLAARQRERRGAAQPARARSGRAVWGGSDVGEAGRKAAQARPDQDEERAGETAEADAAGDGMAQALDDAGEAVGHCGSGGGRSGLGHEQK